MSENFHNIDPSAHRENDAQKLGDVCRRIISALDFLSGAASTEVSAPYKSRRFSRRAYETHRTYMVTTVASDILESDDGTSYELHCMRSEENDHYYNPDASDAAFRMLFYKVPINRTWDVKRVAFSVEMDKRMQPGDNPEGIEVRISHSQLGGDYHKDIKGAAITKSDEFRTMEAIAEELEQERDALLTHTSEELSISSH
jgi:hypothetical protein